MRDDGRGVRALRLAGSGRCRSTSRGVIRRRRGFRRRPPRRLSARRRSTRCAGCCRPRTQSNVGIYGTGQAFEALLLRMRAHSAGGSAVLRGRNADRAAQGDPCVSRRASISPIGEAAGASTWPRRATDDRGALRPLLVGEVTPEPRDEVTLTDFDPEGEIKIVAVGALRRLGRCPTISCSAIARE